MFFPAHLFKRGLIKVVYAAPEGRAEAECSQRGELALCSIKPLSCLLPNQVFFWPGVAVQALAIKLASVNGNKHTLNLVKNSAASWREGKFRACSERQNV